MSENKRTPVRTLHDHFGVCRRFKKDPARTSLHESGCLAAGLDPKTTSMHALECVQHGLPRTASVRDLDEAKRMSQGARP